MLDDCRYRFKNWQTAQRIPLKKGWKQLLIECCGFYQRLLVFCRLIALNKIKSKT